MLRTHIPSAVKHKKMSKVDTLKHAVDYIQSLNRMLNRCSADSADSETDDDEIQHNNQNQRHHHQHYQHLHLRHHHHHHHHYNDHDLRSELSGSVVALPNFTLR